MSTAHWILVAVWLALAGCVASGSDAGWVSAGRWLFAGMLAVHAVECVVFLPLLRKARGGLGGQLVQVLLFGVLHVQKLKAEQAATPPV